MGRAIGWSAASALILAGAALAQPQPDGPMRKPGWWEMQATLTGPTPQPMRQTIHICTDAQVERAQNPFGVRNPPNCPQKLATRAGMGLCQGRTCRRLVSRIIAEETGQNPADILPTTSRPPVRTLPLGTLARGEDDE